MAQPEALSVKQKVLIGSRGKLRLNPSDPFNFLFNPFEDMFNPLHETYLTVLPLTMHAQAQAALGGAWGIWALRAPKESRL